MIAVGRRPNSKGLKFYNPSNGTFTSSIDYKFQNYVTSGAHFNMKYQPVVFIYRPTIPQIFILWYLKMVTYQSAQKTF